MATKKSELDSSTVSDCPHPSIIDVGSAQLACFVWGDESQPTVLIETSLFATSAEWWHVASAWSGKYRVILYDRAGYGRSTVSMRPRTPRDISTKAFSLLDRLGITEPVEVVGHSMGGLYAQQHARMFPDRVCGLVLLDPVCANNAQLKTELTAAEYQASGADKSQNLRWGWRLCAIGLGIALRPLLAKAPPFYYKPDFSGPARDYILRHSARARSYRVARDEYAILEQRDALAALSTADGFPPIAVELVLHAPEVMIEEIMHYGGADRSTATKIDQTWSRLMRSCLALTPHSRETVTKCGSHYLHLTAPDEVLEAMTAASRGARNSKGGRHC
jgi:pimeloyl-ACP methyl ester carboxylesterase